MKVTNGRPFWCPVQLLLEKRGSDQELKSLERREICWASFQEDIMDSTKKAVESVWVFLRECENGVNLCWTKQIINVLWKYKEKNKSISAY